MGMERRERRKVEPEQTKGQQTNHCECPKAKQNGELSSGVWKRALSPGDLRLLINPLQGVSEPFMVTSGSQDILWSIR